jgi:hypothetical protein
MQKVDKNKWYTRWWVWIIIIFIALTLLTLIDGNKKEADKTVVNDDKINNSTAKAGTTALPKIADYLNKSMADLAKEFGKTYNPIESHQMTIEKDGYELYFENGMKFASAESAQPLYDDIANIVSITVPGMGKCEQSQVFNKANEAMAAAGLDTANKGKREGSDGTKTMGYAVYKGYMDQESLESSVVCVFNGDTYKVQLRVLPEFR